MKHVFVTALAALALLGYGLYGHASKPEPLDWRLLLHAWLALLAGAGGMMITGDYGDAEGAVADSTFKRSP